MVKGRLADVLVGTIGNAAASVTDPRQGWAQLKAKATSPAVLGVGAALVAGYLLGRRHTG